LFDHFLCFKNRECVGTLNRYSACNDVICVTCVKNFRELLRNTCTCCWERRDVASWAVEFTLNEPNFDTFPTQEGESYGTYYKDILDEKYKDFYCQN